MAFALLKQYSSKELKNWVRAAVTSTVCVVGLNVRWLTNYTQDKTALNTLVMASRYASWHNAM